jgi:hypothetical protein
MTTLKQNLLRLLLVSFITQNAMIAEAVAFQADDMQPCTHSQTTDAMMSDSMVSHSQMMSMGGNSPGDCALCKDQMDEEGMCCIDDCQNACHYACPGTSILSSQLFTVLLSPDDPQYAASVLGSSLHPFTLLRPPSIA